MPDPPLTAPAEKMLSCLTSLVAALGDAKYESVVTLVSAQRASALKVSIEHAIQSAHMVLAEIAAGEAIVL